MPSNIFASLLVCLLLLASAAAETVGIASLAPTFLNPPTSARAWVYWTWIDGNMNKEGVTADLEAMKRAGLGGAIILDVSQSMPHGPVKFFDGQWKELVRHAVLEAKRLGLEINVNNGPGYYGSGGPWVPPEKSMQTVVQSEVHITGGTFWKGQLPRPNQNPEYHDIAVLAIRETTRSKYQIPDFMMKALQWKTWIAYRGTDSAPLDATAPADAIIPLKEVIDLTARMKPDGSLNWSAPTGEWTLLRFGHASNGHIVGPSAPGEAGPETDKLDKAATRLHFDAFVKTLNNVVGPAGKGALVATHIDSWEGGGQNWTTAMRAEFKKRRGYDLVPYLPILTGRVLGDLQISERFLFDLRQTVSELMIENYTEEFQRLAHEAGLRNTFESYTTIGHDLDNAAYADEPMAEFWTPNGQGLDFQPTIKSMSSAAHLNGRSIVGAESFTSGNQEKFLWHPAMIKSIGDTAFCGGINRFVFHRYAAQPFARADGKNVQPGMQMGPWGLHYERTNTWWEFSGPWHDYLARCQYLLRQGTFVADVLKLESEEPLHRFKDMALTGYDFDACGPATFRRGSVRDGKIVFPSGANYRLILLPDSPSMSVALLARIRDLVQAGAVILGNPPKKTPGLTNFPAADRELEKLVAQIWGMDASATDRPLGKGRVFRGIKPEQALAELKISPDFTSNAGLKFIHRSVNGAEVYFLSHPGKEPIVANCVFRVAGKQPEWWDAETGRVTPLPAYSVVGETTTISLPFQPAGSGFVVFQPAAQLLPHLVKITRDGVAEPNLSLVSGELDQPGEYVFTKSDGTTQKLTIPTPPPPISLDGPWQLRFPAGWGAPAEITLDNLASWSQSADPGVKYFSGTATYAKKFTLPPLAPGQAAYLNLGSVQVMAKVRLNGKDLGILWKPPYRVDLTPALKPGENALEIDIVNLWINRLIGDEQLPEDSERNGNGTVKTWPKWLLDGQPSPTGRLTFSSWRLWKKDDALVDSGLLGPVTINIVPRLTLSSK